MFHRIPVVRSSLTTTGSVVAAAASTAVCWQNLNGEIWSRNNYRSTFCRYIELKRRLIASIECFNVRAAQLNFERERERSGFSVLPPKSRNMWKESRFASFHLLLQNKTWTTTFQNVKWKQKLKHCHIGFGIRMQAPTANTHTFYVNMNIIYFHLYFGLCSVWST